MEIDLDQLPAKADYKNINEFLGVTNEQLWEACQESEARMKGCDTNEAKEAAFGLKRELIVQTADELMRRNLEYLAEHYDQSNPRKMIQAAIEAPKDKPAWTLKLLRKHGFTTIPLGTFIAADNFLNYWWKQKTMEMVRMLASKLPPEMKR